MVSRRVLLAAIVSSLLMGLLGIFLYAQARAARCQAVPLLAPELLPNADLRAGAGKLPAGWGGTATISATTFTVLPGGRSLQLLGIASYVQSPDVRPVRAGQTYCFIAQALTDSPAGSPTRVQLEFQWLDGSSTLVQSERTVWQDVALWRPDAPPAGWSPIGGAFVAPPGAAALRVRVRPSSDDRVYLDQMHLRAGGDAFQRLALPSNLQSPIAILPWPNGKRAAVSFSFDWETAMGGLVHSRSVGDPNFSQDFLLRGTRMREGITTTLAIFRPYGVRATYYATGYNFLLGNAERRTFMNNPTFTWATTQTGWLSDTWRTTPWFAPDPHGTAQSDPAWYFGDLIAPLQRERQSIQSHTFSHLYGGLASPSEWQQDFASWNQAASERGVAPAVSLAFPWSGSDGMSDAAWFLLEQQGIRSVTRTSGYNQANLFALDARGLMADPRCRPVPGHEAILACPDFYLTPERAALALEQIARTLEVSGTIDLWAHTEEVLSPAQIAAWQQVVRAAATNPQVWVAPLDEIAGWQIAVAKLRIENAKSRNGAGSSEPALSFAVSNDSERDLQGLTLLLPFAPGRVTIDGRQIAAGSSAVLSQSTMTLDIDAGQRIEVMVWPEGM